MLKRFKESPKQRERDIFLCMMVNFFEEYKFFPEEYPQRELHVTAILFGGIIDQGLISPTSQYASFRKLFQLSFIAHVNKAVLSGQVELLI